MVMERLERWFGGQRQVRGPITGALAEEIERMEAWESYRDSRPPTLTHGLLPPEPSERRLDTIHRVTTSQCMKVAGEEWGDRVRLTTRQITQEDVTGVPGGWRWKARGDGGHKLAVDDLAYPRDAQEKAIGILGLKVDPQDAARIGKVRVTIGGSRVSQVDLSELYVPVQMSYHRWPDGRTEARYQWSAMGWLNSPVIISPRQVWGIEIFGTLNGEDALHFQLIGRVVERQGTVLA